jgi:hypothetical protein
VSKGIVLDLCGGTGAWSEPYKEAGYDVHVITLPEYDITKTAYRGSVIVFKQDTNGMLMDELIRSNICPVRIKDIVGILAAPPCTEFSVAKNTKPRDLAEGMVAVEACIRIIWEVQKRTKLDFWALENPRGLLRRFLGKPVYTFEQWQFGKNGVKATDIWGYFNPPKPTVKVRPEIIMWTKHGLSKSMSDPAIPPEYADYFKLFTSHNDRRAAARAITPAGFAEAFYRANRPKERK